MTNEQSVWLIECRGLNHPLWLSTHKSCQMWLPSALSAIRFSRKEDAEAIISHYRIENAFASEHLFIDHPTSNPTEVRPQAPPHHDPAKFYTLGCCCMHCDYYRKFLIHKTRYYPEGR